ncbi:MAG: hypothetical protein AAFV26_07885, partial [Pseudomonadota bacterium]
VPVVDRMILNQQVNGQKVYYAQETQVTNAKWLSSGRTVITSCVPLVLFTGAAEGIADPTARQNHQDLIKLVREMRSDALLPQQSIFSRILKRTKQLSAAGTERLSKVSEQARQRAKPLLEKAKAAGRKFYEQAKDGARVMIDKAKPAPKAADGQ